MFKTDISDIVQYLVDSNLNRYSSVTTLHKEGKLLIVKEGVYIRFQVRASHSVWDTNANCYVHDESVYDDVHIVACGNTNVFYYVGVVKDYKKGSFEGLDLSLFKNSSNHDSCWRTDGLQFLSNLYFNMCDEVKFEGCAPIDCTAEAIIPTFFKLERVKVVMKVNKDSSLGGQYSLDDLKSAETLNKGTCVKILSHEPWSPSVAGVITAVLDDMYEVTDFYGNTGTFRSGDLRAV